MREEADRQTRTGKRQESEPCLVGTFKGCTCRTADGGKAPLTG